MPKLDRVSCSNITQGFEVQRLKDKLGTRPLPTAELRLLGMRALKARAGWWRGGHLLLRACCIVLH